jgi:protocatechuate 3,4-dioxygenase beta subunit
MAGATMAGGQSSMRAEMTSLDVPAPDPAYYCPAYRSTALRSPKNPLRILPAGLTERRAPVFGPSRVRPEDADLTAGLAGEPLGERVVVAGEVLDAAGRPVRNQLVEIWQANASGRYNHSMDKHPAPLDPNFAGAGRCLTDDLGRYRFITIKPGPYPWQNHHNAWRPAHIHFSVFGTNFTERLVTQMYFPGDPLLPLDPIYQSIRDKNAALALVSRFDLGTTVEGWALGYRFDIVLGGPTVTPVEL